MEKGKLCTDHFIVNCSLCSEEEQVVYPPAGIPAGTKEMERYESVKIDILESHPEPPPLQSEEAISVMSAADEYARACEAYDSASAAVKSMEEHIRKLEQTVVDLRQDSQRKKVTKSELKKKMIESLQEEKE